MPMQYNPKTGRFEEVGSSSAGALQAVQQRGEAQTSSAFSPITGNTTPTYSFQKPREPERGALGTAFDFVTKQLNKPSGALSEIYEGIGGGIASGLTGGGLKGFGREVLRGGREAFDVLRGTRESSFSQKLGNVFEDVEQSGGAFSRAFIPQTKFGKTAVGLGSDVILDPLNLIGGGLSKSGKFAKRAQTLRREGEVIRPGSQLAQGLAKYGDVPLGVNKAEQAARGQRALLTIANKPVIRGTRFYQATGRASNALGASKLGQAARRTFTTKTTNQGFDIFKQQAKNIGDYRTAKAIEFGKDIQKQLSKFSKDEVSMISRVIENPALRAQATDGTLAVADTISKKFTALVGQEQSVGVIKETLENYFPHIKKAPSISGLPGGAKDFDATLQAANRRHVGELIDAGGKSQGIVSLKTEGLRFLKDVPKVAKGSSKLRKAKTAGFDVYNPKKPGIFYKFKSAPLEDINKKFGSEFFESNPAIAATTRAVASAKAVTGAEFLTGVKQFGKRLKDADIPSGWVTTKNPELKGMLFEPEVGKAIDSYIQGIKPEEIATVLKVFDKVQNLWKAQALVSPSYHVRNSVGNLWNNFLAGVVDPKVYVDATRLMKGKLDNKVFTTTWGKKLKGSELLEEARKLGVLDQGLFAKDIEAAIDITKGGFNPFDQNNKLFRANRVVGEAVENQARMAHFLDRIAKGDSFTTAAESVKKYLFDYGDLSNSERNVLKRLLPFYTWTRKNIPLQLEAMLKQPVKFALIDKVTRAIEGNVEEPDERFLSDYIKNNIPIRIKKTEDGVTHYFLMGQWLPGTQAIDFLDSPIDNVLAMVTPFFKVPFELASGKSTFFKDTLGRKQDIERYEEEVGSFLGLAMRKRTINVLKNFRLLNEIDKLNPGEIWGTKESESIWSKLIGERSANLPGIGAVSTAQQRGTSYSPDVSGVARGAGLFFGKLQGYDPQLSKQFYDWDTDGFISNMKTSIKKARNRGQDAYAEELQNRLDSFIGSRETGGIRGATGGFKFTPPQQNNLGLPTPGGGTATFNQTTRRFE